MNQGRAASLLILSLSLGAAGGAGAQGGPPPKPVPVIAFEEKAVVAGGLSPGEKVAWFGVERLVDADLSGELVRHYDLKTAGADGVSRMELKREVAARSMWVAVDVKSGEFIVAAPEGYRVARAGKPSRLGVGEGELADGLEDERPYLYGLVVRPGEGAWAFAGGDGGPRDEDGENNGRLRFALDKLEPLPGSPEPPAKARGNDLWFVVDPLKMEISVHKGGLAQ